MSSKRNQYLDAGFSDSDHEVGYDSEAAEFSKGGSKRRKLSSPARDLSAQVDDTKDGQNKELEARGALVLDQRERTTSVSVQDTRRAPAEVLNRPKASKPGVIYLSSLPPYLKPSALRNLLTQRGFSPIVRLFLAPTSKAKNHHSPKKNSRQLYAEGWIEFKSKRTAKRCAETLNATTIGGRKGGFYHDDIWNMKYLRGVGWDDLMAQVREERNEEEVKRMEERRQIAKETKDFIEGVEKGKVARGIEKSRQKKRKKDGQAPKTGLEDGQGDQQRERTWRQYKVKGVSKARGDTEGSGMSDNVKNVLNKIF